MVTSVSVTVCYELTHGRSVAEQLSYKRETENRNIWKCTTNPRKSCCKLLVLVAIFICSTFNDAGLLRRPPQTSNKPLPADCTPHGIQLAGSRGSPQKQAKAVPLHAMKALGGRARIAHTSSHRYWMVWVVIVTPGRALGPWERTPRYPPYRRLGGPQRRSGHRGYRKKSFCLCRGSNPNRPVVQSVVTLHNCVYF
jgi:hypothetical protein